MFMDKVEFGGNGIGLIAEDDIVGLRSFSTQSCVRHSARILFLQFVVQQIFLFSNSFAVTQEI